MTEQAYIVLNKRGMLFEGQFDEAEANKTAKDIEGVVVAVPISADYRRPEDKG